MILLSKVVYAVQEFCILPSQAVLRCDDVIWTLEAFRHWYSIVRHELLYWHPGWFNILLSLDRSNRTKMF